MQSHLNSNWLPSFDSLGPHNSDHGEWVQTCDGLVDIGGLTIYLDDIDFGESMMVAYWP